jgi:tetratricopeptide (TPR) repeat protein
VDPKERWQALQAHLGAARAFVNAGDRARALQQIDAALRIDPEYLAAQTLRERILAPAAVPDEHVDAAPTDFDLPLRAPVPASPTVAGPSASAAPATAPLAAPAAGAPPVVPAAAPAVDAARIVSAAPPVVNAAGYARFEQRAKRRRVDRRLEAARVAIERRRLKEAGAALDEVLELDPNEPELAALIVAFDNLRRSQTRVSSHRGPSLAAAAVFAAIVLGATWIEDPAALLSYPFAAISSLVSSTAPVPLEEAALEIPIDLPPVSPDTQVEPAREETAGTSGNQASGDSEIAPAVARRESVPEPARDPVRESASAARPADVPAVVPATAPAVPATPLPPPAAPDAAPNTTEPRTTEALPSQAKVEAPAALLPSSAPSTPAVPRESASTAAAPAADASAVAAKAAAELDESLVRQALQRYRVAYDGLDARSAQAVWPAVNRSALARAFDGLESQRLTFESCELQLLTNTATATCRGTARYVPKIGSREPRVEPRVWTFSLRRAGTDWKIDSARVQP